jgi:hypothetical protein
MIEVGLGGLMGFAIPARSVDDEREIRAARTSKAELILIFSMGRRQFYAAIRAAAGTGGVKPSARKRRIPFSFATGFAVMKRSLASRCR